MTLMINADAWVEYGGLVEEPWKGGGRGCEVEGEEEASREVVGFREGEKWGGVSGEGWEEEWKK